MDDITIRRAESPGDFRALQHAQRLAWGIADDSLVLPIATMVAAQHFGGLVLGAFTDEGEAVALSFAFLARLRGRIVLYSQLTGVIPTHQSLGLGTRIKEAQRAFCRSEGIAAIAWAFDPFRPGNARFNLNKLGATCRDYVQDMYGPRDDALNAGQPTDRLIAEWELESRPREESTEGADALPCLIQTDSDGRPRFARSDSPRVLIEVPDSIATIGQPDAWRAAVRLAFAASIAQGLRATAFVPFRDRITGSMRGAYRMEPDPFAIGRE